MLTSTGSASLNRTRWVLVLLCAFAASAFAQTQNGGCADDLRIIEMPAAIGGADKLDFSGTASFLTIRKTHVDDMNTIVRTCRNYWTRGCFVIRIANPGGRTGGPAVGTTKCGSRFGVRFHRPDDVEGISAGPALTSRDPRMIDNRRTVGYERGLRGVEGVSAIVRAPNENSLGAGTNLSCAVKPVTQEAPTMG
jgi:hypothetical protein